MSLLFVVVNGMLDNLDLVETWLNTVAYSHSGSEGTKNDYRFAFQYFSKFIEKTPQQILTEYEGSTDREFKFSEDFSSTVRKK